MNFIYQWLLRFTGPMPNLIEFLKKAGDASPDLKPTADKWIGVLQNAALPANLLLVATLIPAELLNIGSGKIDPRDSPSNAV